jgi:hypothetical protein
MGKDKQLDLVIKKLIRFYKKYKLQKLALMRNDKKDKFFIVLDRESFMSSSLLKDLHGNYLLSPGLRLGADSKLGGFDVRIAPFKILRLVKKRDFIE